MNSSGSGDGPVRLGARACSPLGVCARGRPRLGIGGVPRSDMRELGRRTRAATGIDDPIVRLPSMLSRGARGVDEGMCIELLPPPPPPPEGLWRAPAMRLLGRGMALSSARYTTRDRSLAVLMRVSSAFILAIISAIMRLEPAAPLPAVAVRGVDGTPLMRAAARTDARSCARADGDEVRCEAPSVWLRRGAVDEDAAAGLSSCTEASVGGSEPRTSRLRRREWPMAPRRREMGTRLRLGDESAWRLEGRSAEAEAACLRGELSKLWSDRGAGGSS